ncbi:hypothetical protein [Streptomyces sp.]|uniref:hypothetical protein n=1 Tax=Streptomyces sp. TaxID=1931 RepID=UPI00281158CD|nr:hypothetical protein [Streptomyces sp.]
MTWSAALSGVALRVMRTVAGRRALEVALLVGAVFVLGMLCGERAQAADGVPGETSSASPSAGTAGTAGSSTPTSVDGVRVVRLSGEAGRAADQDPPAGSGKGEGAEPRADAPRPGRPETAKAPAGGSRPPATGPTAADAGPSTAGAGWSGAGAGSSVADAGPSGADVGTVQTPWAVDLIRPPAESLVRSVGERVVRPAGELVGAVTGRPAASPGKPPVPPLLPGLTQPAPPPGLPGLPAVPGHTLPTPAAPGPGAGATAPRPEAPTASTPPPADAPAPDGRDGQEGRDGAAAPVAFGPETTDADAGGATRDGDGHGAPRGAAHTEPAPAPHAPAGRPDGTVGNRSTADNGTPRHGDAHAVTPCPRPPLRLVPGAIERAEATGTRDRYRDVPVSPA